MSYGQTLIQDLQLEGVNFPTLPTDGNGMRGTPIDSIPMEPPSGPPMAPPSGPPQPLPPPPSAPPLAPPMAPPSGPPEGWLDRIREVESDTWQTVLILLLWGIIWVRFSLLIGDFTTAVFVLFPVYVLYNFYYSASATPSDADQAEGSVLVSVAILVILFANKINLPREKTDTMVKIGALIIILATLSQGVSVAFRKAVLEMATTLLIAIMGVVLE